MGTLQPDEINLIAVMYLKPPMCPARSYGIKIIFGPTPEEILDIQMFLRQISQPCKEIWALKRLYEDHCIRKWEKDRQQRDPTTQEHDRKTVTRNKGE